MQFSIQRKQNENIHKYPTDDLKLADVYVKKLKNELGDFLVAAVLFGSSARGAATAESDTDILLVGDDISFQFTDALVQAYRVIVENVTAATSRKLHITSMTLTSFWEYARVGDPVAINMLRDGVALLDTGFFTPLQALLKQGRIRPSEESIWRYFGRSPRTLVNSRWHVLQATLDLYWAVMDSAHAALMKRGEIPPSPEHAADLLYEKLVRARLLEPEHAETVRRFYHLSKMITHREIKHITGAEYDRYLKEATGFVERMKMFIEEHH